MQARLDALISLLQTDGPLPAARIVERLGISQPVLSRAIQSAGARIVRLGAARSTRYAARHGFAGVGSEWPVYRIDQTGSATATLRLVSLAQGQFAGFASRPLPALGFENAQRWPDLPWFLDDARPQGFLGRALARQLADGFDVPANPELWNASHTLRGWLAAGDDLPGDLVVGQAPMQRLQQRFQAPPQGVDAAQRAQSYAVAAQAAMAGDIAGSSAAGEQPKFACAVRDADGGWRHVLVKFTADQHSPAKRRWCDLLIAEHHALTTLGEHGIDAARSELVLAGERLCLEVTRFDRVGAHGRRGVVSLRALSAEHDGALHDPWPEVAARLQAAGWVAAGELPRVERLWWFGRLIANSDMHHGNLSWFIDHSRPLALAPAYDMLPMAYQPAANGEIVPRAFKPPLPLPEQRDGWLDACGAAMACWGRIAADPRVSAALREISRDNAITLERTAGRV